MDPPKTEGVPPSKSRCEEGIFISARVALLSGPAAVHPLGKDNRALPALSVLYEPPTVFT